MSRDDKDAQADPVFGEVIFSYTRAQAIEDGVLVDESEAAREVGIKCPLAVTTRVSELLGDCESPQSRRGRLHDLVWLARCALHKAPARFTVWQQKFEVIMGRAHERVSNPLREFVLHLGPGDEGELVATITRPGED